MWVPFAKCNQLVKWKMKKEMNHLVDFNIQSGVSPIFKSPNFRQEFDKIQTLQSTLLLLK